MNFFKLLIPKEKAQEITELESWTVTWKVKEGWADQNIVRSKVFIKIDDAKEFEKQIIESAKFIGCWITTNLSKN